MSGVDVLAVIDAEIADLRLVGDTGNVENLLDARDAVVDLLLVAERAARLNPDAGEIGAGMLARLVSEARSALARCQPAEIPGMTMAEEAAEVHKR